MQKITIKIEEENGRKLIICKKNVPTPWLKSFEIHGAVVKNRKCALQVPLYRELLFAYQLSITFIATFVGLTLLSRD